MSKGFGKKALLHNKKGSKSNSNQNSPSKATATDEDDKLMVKFVFEGEKFHARTPIMFEQLSLSDLLKKITLDITLPPPSANELFEKFFKEDIYPYIRHNIQSQIRNKRDITKLWDLQSIILQKIYEQRAELLCIEWTKLRKKNKNLLAEHNHLQSDENEELLRKKAELKAKNKANKQKWKDQIAMQIASGQFDEPEIKKSKDENNSNKIAKRKKKKDQKKNKPITKKSKPNKPIKKKKVKKWKDKKTKKQVELWPGIVNKQPIANTVYSNKKSAAEQLKENLKKLEEQNNGTIRDKKLILSEVKYKLILRSEHNEYIMDNENNNMSLVPKDMDPIIGIKIWIYMCDIHTRIENEKDEIWLNTNRNEVLLNVNNVKLFEVVWSQFGTGINRKIDENNINVVFVKKSKVLRVKIPILGM